MDGIPVTKLAESERDKLWLRGDPRDRVIGQTSVRAVSDAVIRPGPALRMKNRAHRFFLIFLGLTGVGKETAKALTEALLTTSET